MELHGALVSAEMSPWEKRHAKVYCAGFEDVGRLIEADAEVLASVELACVSDENLSEVGIDAPVPSFVRICQSTLGGQAAEARMIELAALRFQTDFDVAQTFSECQLSESQAEELLQT